MNFINKLVKCVYSPKAIFNLRKTNVFLSILVLIFLGLLLCTPQIIQLYLDDNYHLDIGQVDNSYYDQWINDLPDAIIEDNELKVKALEADTTSYPLSEYLTLILDPNNLIQEVDTNKDYLIFGRNMVYVQIESFKGTYPYYQIDVMNLTEKITATADVKNNIEGIVSELILLSKPMWIGPQASFIYLAQLANFLVFIFTITLIGLVIRFSKIVKITMKETFNTFTYSAILPILISTVIGLLLPNFTFLSLSIVNFGTIIMAYIVYSRYLLKRSKKKEHKKNGK